MATVKELQDKLVRMATEIAAQRAAGNPAAQNDLNAAAEEVENAKAEQTRAAAVSAAPSTLKGTVEQAQADQIRALETVIGNLSTVIEQLAARNEDTSNEVAQLRKAQSDLAREQSRKVEFSDGKIKGEFKRDDFEKLMRTSTSNEQIREVMKDKDLSYLLDRVKLYQHRHGTHEFLPGVEQTEETAAFKRLVKNVRAMYTGGSGTGAELIGTAYSARIHELYQSFRKVAGHFPRITAPAGYASFVMPVITANPTVYIVGERSNDDGSNITASNFSTASRTFTPKTIGARTRLSYELTEESLAASQDYIESGYAKALAGAEEDCLINGDATGAHMDSSVTSDDDVKKFMDGIRAGAIASSAQADLGTWADATMLGLVGTMGDYCDDPAALLVIWPTTAYWKYFAASANFAPFYAVGAPGASQVGPVGLSYFGMKSVCSAKVRRDLNATGVYDGSTMTKTEVIAVRPDQWLLVDWREMKLELGRDIETQQIIAVGSTRFMGKKLAGSSEKTEVVGYNVA